MKKIVIICCFLSITAFAHAMPGTSSKEDAGKAAQMAEEKFINMDSDKDGNVDATEFKKAYPQMTDAVFGIIDTDKDKGINRKEWMDFQAKHMQGMQEHETDKKPASKSPMLIKPPKDK